MATNNLGIVLNNLKREYSILLDEKIEAKKELDKLNSVSDSITYVEEKPELVTKEGLYEDKLNSELYKLGFEKIYSEACRKITNIVNNIYEIQKMKPEIDEFNENLILDLLYIKHKDTSFLGRLFFTKEPKIRLIRVVVTASIGANDLPKYYVEYKLNKSIERLQVSQEELTYEHYRKYAK